MFRQDVRNALPKFGIRESFEELIPEEESQWIPEEEPFRDLDESSSESSKEFDFTSSSSSSPDHRFFADSPYYDAFVEKEIFSSEVIHNTLKDIGTETESFSRAADTMLKSFRSLSSSCRQASNTIQQGADQMRIELVPEIDMLQALGETLDEISAAQKNMFDTIETCLGYHHQELAVKQVAVISKLKKDKKEADIITKHSEQEICKYLNGNSATVTDPSMEQEFIFCVPNPTERMRSIGNSIRRSHELRWSQRIRMEETNAELKRFQLIKNTVDANYDRRLELNRSHGEVLEAMHICFQTCLDKVANMMPLVAASQQQCSDYQNNKKPLWKEREKSLVQTLTTMRRAGEISVTHCKTGDEVVQIEHDTHIWDLPCELATVSKFRRPSPRDVLMEGWLYQQCSSIMSLKLSWVRRWFILKPNGIYYIEPNAEVCKFEKVKLCDIVLCTVKELPKKSPARFCFELIHSSNEKTILQARGPKELQMWLDRFHSALGSELAKSNHDVETSIPQLRRMSSEIISTVLERKSWHVWDRENSCELEESVFTAETGFPKDIENPLIADAVKANPTCADCGADSPCWVSLNLGILVCLECSGVHRSLGCHISKVRSLKLDTLSRSEASLLLSLGNERINKIWEKEVKPGSKTLKDLACTHDRAAREDWIKRKYVKKEFLGRSSNVDLELEEKLSRELYIASKKGDVTGVATAIAHGANLNWKNDEEKDGPCTALEMTFMQLDAGKNGAAECAELLLQNGAKVAKDDDSACQEERSVSSSTVSTTISSASSDDFKFKTMNPAMARLLGK